MAREYGRVFLSIWSDPDFVLLDSCSQRLYLLLLTQPGMSTCGVQTFSPRRWAKLAPDTTARKVARAVAALEAPRLVVVDRRTDEILVRSFVRYDLSLRSANVTKHLVKTLAQVTSGVLRDAVRHELYRLKDDLGDNGWAGWKVPAFQQLLEPPFGQWSEPPSEPPFQRRS